MENKVIKKGQFVFLGSTSLSKIDLAGYLDNIDDKKVYNCSMEGLTIDQVENNLDTILANFHPSKLFINIGEEDLKDKNFNLENFIEKYEWMLFQINTKCKDCRLFLISIFDNSIIGDKVNKALEKLSEETGCKFIKLNPTSIWDSACILRMHLRTFPINFMEAMQYRG
jgi:hypothetical protein